MNDSYKSVYLANQQVYADTASDIEDVRELYQMGLITRIEYLGKLTLKLEDCKSAIASNMKQIDDPWAYGYWVDGYKEGIYDGK